MQLPPSPHPSPRRDCCFLFILCLSIICVNSVHLRNHHQSSSGFAYLTGIEDSLMASIRTLKANAESNNNLLLQTQDIDAKIRLLETYLLEQRKMLLNTYKSSLFDLTNTHYTCPPIDSNDRPSFTSFNQNINQKFTDLAEVAQKATTDNNSTLKDEINSLLPYVKTANLPVDAKSEEVGSGNYQIQNNININSGKLVMGKAEAEKLTTGYSNAAMPGKYNVICAGTTPFLDRSGKCIACPPQQPYYIVDNATCIACNTYNQTAKQCFNAQGNPVVGATFFTNFTAATSQILLAQSQNLTGYTTNAQNLPECPSSTPFSNGNVCIACPKGLYYSLADNNCQTCPEGKFYNIYNHKCQIQYYFSNLNNLQWQTTSKGIDDILESITIKRSNQSYTSCPLNQPFSIDSSCISCANGTHFSYDTLTCTSCSNETKLDLNMHKCLKPGNLNFQTNPVNTTNLIYNGLSTNEWMNIYYQNVQKYSGIVDCPQETPNFDGLACISCPHSHPYFNMQLMVCQACEGTTLYDQNQRQCVSNYDKRPIQTPTWQKMAAVVFSK